jgi:hypothetical protein
MFAYVRLCSLNGRKNVGKSNGERPEATEGTEVTEDAQEGSRKNAECRKKSLALRTAITADCKMHEMMNRRSQCGTAVEPSNLGPT